MTQSPESLFGRSRRGGSLLLGVGAHLFATILQAAGHGRAFLECVCGFREALQASKLYAHHVIIRGVLVRWISRGFFQLCDGLLVVLATEINQAQSTVRLRFALRLHLGELLVGHVRRFRKSRENFQSVLFIFLALIESAFRCEIVGIEVVRDHPANQHQHGDVVRIQRQRFVGVGIHLRQILLGIFGGGEPLIHLGIVLAAGIFLDVLLAKLNALICVFRFRIADRFFTTVFLRVRFRHWGGRRRLRLLLRWLLRLRRSSRLRARRRWGRALLILRERIWRQEKRGEEHNESCLSISG